MELYVTLLHLPCSSADSDSDCSKQSSSKSQIARLKKDLMCDYDSTIRPVINEANGTTVSFRMLLKYFTYDVASSTLALDMWMPTFWKDQHLQWKPKDYENITRINFNSYSLWTPDLSVYNRAEQGGDPSAFSYTYCAVTSTGNVLCVPSVHIDALCVPDLSRYPYDVQSCSLRMGSWVYKGEELDIQIYGSVVNTDELEPNGEWEILNTTAKRHPGNHACCPNTTYPSIEILFQIGRLSGAHAASVVIPTIVGMILTFTLLFISPLNQERMVLCYVNLIVQFMHVQYMSWQVPLKGDQIPLLRKYKYNRSGRRGTSASERESENERGIAEGEIQYKFSLDVTIKFQYVDSCHMAKFTKTGLGDNNARVL
ncbi:hypothetical protein NQ317_015072 [Molorchus minor]|uniref:Neurotransmitter-gated ion-channel ligand-binding domain-containing protein n=1 Tax=Molorchus minor TaxID=1323400 RepID=A0ABQ9JLI8_9CUCU|nr:hypothetical protein NQ317_015072 [Molorchus minor]